MRIRCDSCDVTILIMFCRGSAAAYPVVLCKGTICFLMWFKNCHQTRQSPPTGRPRVKPRVTASSCPDKETVNLHAFLFPTLTLTLCEVTKNKLFLNGSVE